MEGSEQPEKDNKEPATRSVGSDKLKRQANLCGGEAGRQRSAMAGLAEDPHRPALPLLLGDPWESPGKPWWILPGSPNLFSEAVCT